jgi:hypothetical protein
MVSFAGHKSNVANLETVIDELGDANTWLSKPKPRRKPNALDKGYKSENRASFSLPSFSLFRGSSKTIDSSPSQEDLSQTTNTPRKPSFM